MKRFFRYLLVLLVFAPKVWSQSIAINKADAAAGTRIIKTDNIKGAEPRIEDSVGKRGVILFSAGYQSAIVSGKTLETYFVDLNIVHNDNRLGCLEENKSKVLLTLDDGTRIECLQISENDCDPAAFHGAYALMPKGADPATMRQSFEKLMATGIKQIDVYTTEKTLTYEVKKSMKDYLKKHFALIDRAIKGSAK